MRDFTVSAYRSLLNALKYQSSGFYGFAGVVTAGHEAFIILRHDVDRKPGNALVLARAEADSGIKASYHFRLPGDRYQEDVIREIAGLGHEVAYHYEDLSSLGRALPFRQRVDEETARLAYDRFRMNLASLRKVAEVAVISMHGSPLSGIDSRLLWKYYDYHEEGIICEPYFDINPDKILSLTDTGRRWNATGSNRRDHIPGRPRINRNFFDGKYPRSTFQLIQKIKDGLAPELMVISAHPQRWTNGIFPWLEELIWQNTKNLIKSLLRD